MKIIYFDTETTGLNPKKDKIIEIALYVVENQKVVDKYDRFIKLDEPLDEEIIELTGITDKDLQEDGVSESVVAWEVMNKLSAPCLMVAHNTQFDLNFLYELLVKYYGEKEVLDLFAKLDWLDTLTVFKDRKKYPHRLNDLVDYYNLGDFQFHRAIDDARVLPYALVAMSNERNDVLKYVNVFGYNKKYNVTGKKFDFINYVPQDYHYQMVKSNKILPYIKKK